MSKVRALAGHVVTFAGRLASLTRRQAAELVVRSGGAVENDLSDRTTLLVVGAGPAPEGAEADADVTSDPAIPLTPRAHTMTEEEFCRLVDRVPPSELRQHYHTSRAVRARYPAIHDDHLRHLEKWGLLRSVVRTPGVVYYGFTDLAVVKQVNAELEQGGAFRAIVRALIAARDGQLTFDFRPDQARSGAGQVVSLASRSASGVAGARLAAHVHDGMPTAAEARFLDGERLESGEAVNTEAAMQAYREAIAMDGRLAPAMVNLGNLHYSFDHLAEAQALYVQAMLVDASCYEAHFNLGNVHHDLGRLEQAVLCYTQALALSPDFADAHFYLAVTLEKLGRSQEARPHWQSYLRLAPNGEWADLAEEFSD
jgi:hypothetical protein